MPGKRVGRLTRPYVGQLCKGDVLDVGQSRCVGAGVDVVERVELCQAAGGSGPRSGSLDLQPGKQRDRDGSRVC